MSPEAAVEGGGDRVIGFPYVSQVIRVHLGWLIVWGNVFGSCIGVASVALGYP